MAWPGYFVLNGVEVVNATRTEAYTDNAGARWLKPVYKATDLGLILGETYGSPLSDDAPWTDPKTPDSYNFWGCYPLDVTGFEDSTGTAPVTESTLDGGVVGAIRRSTRSLVFNLVLIGANECAVEFGMRWLNQVIANYPCGSDDRHCSGMTACYLSCAPCLEEDCDDPQSCLATYQRTLRNVGVITGPTVTGRNTMTDGGTAWMVTLTMVAGNPFQFGYPTALIEGFMDPNVDDPYVGGVPEGGIYDLDGTDQSDSDCSVPTYQPVYDPECPYITPPPPVPTVPMVCFDFPVNYRRRLFTIPQQYIPLWGDVVPVAVFRTGSNEVRNLRLRFYADLLGTGDPDVDECAFCGDMVFTYLPPQSVLTFDTVDQLVSVRINGGPSRRGDALVLGTDGKPFDWPILTCGYGYIVTVDLPISSPQPAMDLSLYQRVI